MKKGMIKYIIFLSAFAFVTTSCGNAGEMAEVPGPVKEEHEGKSKAAHGRARKALGEIKKLVTEYRKASVAEDKK